MSDLRERFRALDDLEVPDVMARAQRMGPKAPEPEPSPPLRRAGALVFALLIALLALVLFFRVLNEPMPADRPTPSPTAPIPRGEGEVLRHTGDPFSEGGELVAEDPETGVVRTLVAEDAVEGMIGSAAWSADRSFAAFEIIGCSPQVPDAGLWVANGVDAPRQLTTRPCFPDSEFEPPWEAWAWSPTGDRLAYGRVSDEGNRIVIIDASSGRESELGEPVGEVSAIGWSPDGTAILYGSDPSGSIYSVRVEDSAQTEIVDSLGFIHGDGDAEPDFPASADGAHVALMISVQRGPFRLYLMNADGSGLQPIDDQVQDSQWAPVGSRIAFATYTGPRGERTLRIWTASFDGDPSLVYEGTSFTTLETAELAWSPDGTMIAFSTDTPDDEVVSRVVNASGAGDAREIDPLVHHSWMGGLYTCGCYG